MGVCAVGSSTWSRQKCRSQHSPFRARNEPREVFLSVFSGIPWLYPWGGSTLFCPTNLALLNVITDTGYQGLQKLHTKTQMSKKKSHKNPLTKEDKLGNQNISRAGGANKNVIGMIKRFKIIASRYRNRRKRFTRCSNIIEGIYNLELSQF